MNRLSALRALRANHQVLRGYLPAWEDFLAQVESRNPMEGRHAVSALHGLCCMIEHRMQNGSWQRSFRSLAGQAPQAEPLLRKLDAEQKSLRRNIRDYRRELSRFSSDTRLLRRMGEGLGEALRRHLHRAEIPLLRVRPGAAKPRRVRPEGRRAPKAGRNGKPAKPRPTGGGR